MNKIFLIFILLFPMTSFAEWKKITVAEDNSTIYIDVASIKQNKGYVYYWVLRDFLKPLHGYLSAKALYEVDCEIPRKERAISFSGYLMSMGEGVADFTANEVSEWIYSSPGRVSEEKLEYVCKNINN